MFLNRPILGIALLLSTVSSAQDAPDWKLVGFSEAKGKEPSTGVFYLQSEIKRLPAGIVQVWTKSLSSAKLQRAYESAKKPFIAIVVEKVRSGYQPPYATVTKLTDDQRIDAVSYEVLADEGSINPVARMLWDIDCGQSTYRIVSMITAEREVTHPPGERMAVPPESLIQTLAALACKPSTP